MTLSEFFTIKAPLLDISLVAVITALIANIIFGSIWYSPLFFGENWAEGHKFNIEEMKPSFLHFLGAILISTVMILAIATLIDYFNIFQLKKALVFGAIVWLGFIATSHFSGVVWAKKPLTVYFIDVIYLLICILLTSAILVIIPHYLPESWVTEHSKPAHHRHHRHR